MTRNISIKLDDKIFEEYNIGIHPRRIYTILNRSDLFG